mmetsp:Transcript_45330/g.107863  ORF Transcript_45330/g.107863 Transcript_45330/m.107863 type:complete len:215 (+) Transcript_45330:227-871(+)
MPISKPDIRSLGTARPGSSARYRSGDKPWPRTRAGESGEGAPRSPVLGVTAVTGVNRSSFSEPGVLIEPWCATVLEVGSRSSSRSVCLSEPPDLEESLKLLVLKLLSKVAESRCLASLTSSLLQCTPMHPLWVGPMTRSTAGNVTRAVMMDITVTAITTPPSLLKMVNWHPRRKAAQPNVVTALPMAAVPIMVSANRTLLCLTAENLCRSSRSS